MAEDWRLTNLETQPNLQGVSFARQPYRPYRAGWDHDHCAACGAKLIASGDDNGACHEGYATTAHYLHGPAYEWVCVPCFHAFAPAMGWQEVTGRADP
jgi:hypothetical protein